MTSNADPVARNEWNDNITACSAMTPAEPSAQAQRPLAILSAPGSRGDVNPMIAIGRALRRRGMDVVISLAEPYAPLAEAAGLTSVISIETERFNALLGTPEVWRPLSGLRAVLQGAACDFLIPHFELIRRLLRPGRTILVSHPLDFASRIHRDIDPETPLVDVFLSPAMIRDPQYPPRLTPWWFEPRRPAWLMQSAYWLGDRLLLDPYVAPAINRLRRSLSLSPISRVMDRWWLSPDMILSLYPDWFGQSAPPGEGRWHACGFPLDVNPGAAESPRDHGLIDAADLPPIFFTPGTAHRHATSFFESAIDVCLALKRPGILATSHIVQVPRTLPPSIRASGYVPLDQVLPHCSAIVHHGGIGTTAAAIAAGCPQVVLPMAFDQFHNAQQVVELGLGKSLPRPNRLRLRAALAEVLVDSDLERRGRDFSARTKGRDGAENAADHIESLLAPTKR